MKRYILWALMLLLVVILAAASWFWLHRDAWLAGFNQQRSEEAQLFHKQGLAFGRTASQEQCLSRTIKDFNDECIGYSCTIKYGIFLRACLNEATPSDNFCSGVPAYSAKPSEDDKAWVKDACWRQNVPGEGCRLLIRQQQLFCSEQASAENPS